MELISIIIPVYKVEKYIRRCINSVLCQTYDDIEIILVDDGSPDNCGSICDEYAFVDHRIKVIHKNNGGLSDARNVGKDSAMGKYITFIDSDDWVHKKYIEILYELLKSSNSDISVCNHIKAYTDNLPDLNHVISIREYSNLEALNQLVGKLCMQMIVAWGKLYKIELFNDIYFPVGKIHEDEFTTYKLIYKANKLIYTTEPLLYYWQREDSIMGSGFSIKNKLNAIEALSERVEFFENINQKVLKDKTYKWLFDAYIMVNDHVNAIEDEFLRLKFKENHKKFKSILRKSKQSIKFKLYYESYYISPKLAWLIKYLYEKATGKS